MVSIRIQVRYQCVAKFMLRLLAQVLDFYNVMKRSYEVKSRMRLFWTMRLHPLILLYIHIVI